MVSIHVNWYLGALVGACTDLVQVLQFQTLLLAALVSTAAALTVPAVKPALEATAVVLPRAACVYYCGSVCYWQEDIDEALAQGYKDLKSGSAPGESWGSFFFLVSQLPKYISIQVSDQLIV